MRITLMLVFATFLIHMCFECTSEPPARTVDEASPDESCIAYTSALHAIAEVILNQNEDSPIDWVEILGCGRHVFETMIKEGDWHCFDNILAEFGEGNAALDLLILFSAPNFTTPAHWRFERWTFPDSIDFGITSEEYHASRLRSAQIVAERFYGWNEEKRRRFYQGLVWSGDLRVARLAGLMNVAEETVAGFEVAIGEEVWWYVRSSLLVMYSTGELPEFETLTPDAVQNAFKQWEQRIRYDRLVPSRDGLFWRPAIWARVVTDSDLRDAIEVPLPDWKWRGPSVTEVLDHLDGSIV